MSIFALGFLFIMIFTILVGVGAIVFLSFDSEANKNPTSKRNATTRLFEVVRRINTTTIETVDKSGTVHEWKQSK